MIPFSKTNHLIFLGTASYHGLTLIQKINQPFKSAGNLLFLMVVQPYEIL